MAMVMVHVDASDVLSEVSDRDIEREWRRRRKPNIGEPWTPAGLAEDLRKAFYNRDASRFEALLCVLEKREAVAA